MEWLWCPMGSGVLWFTYFYLRRLGFRHISSVGTRYAWIRAFLMSPRRIGKRTLRRDFYHRKFSLIRIDMAHHKGYLFLRIRCYIGVFWDDSADHLMTDFAASFLIRGWWVAVKNAASSVAVSIEFDAFRDREFTAVIGQTHGKQGYKNIGRSSRYSLSKISETDLASLWSQRKATWRPVETKVTVRSTAPFLMPSTESSWTTGVSGFWRMNAS